MSTQLLFFIAEDWYFCSHRLPIAVEAIRKGYDVYLVTRISDKTELIESSGVHLIPFPMSRRGINPVVEILNLWRLRKIYTTIRPDIVHHVAIKPVCYGTLVAKSCGIKRVVNAFAGLGFLFSSRSRYANALKRFFVLFFKLLLNQYGKLILQNLDDEKTVLEHGIVQKSQILIIRGSGVDLTEYRPIVPGPKPVKRRPVIILVARMLWAKGVGLLIEAARIVNNYHHVADFLLVGSPDQDNPSSISKKVLEQWNKEKGISWLGRCSNIPELLSQSDIACLPSSYGEGVPKSLIEAAAAGLPIITTNSPGCREVVRHNVNGLLVPVDNVIVLSNALLDLIKHPEKRTRMGIAGRKKAIHEFSQESVCITTLALYEALLSQ